MPPRDVLAAASGRWLEILSALGGITRDQLGHPNREGPCPACGGETRFRWDDDEGDAAWFCSHCGGKDRRGGGGTGVDLLMRLRGWSFCEAVGHVDGWLGGAPRIAQGGKRPSAQRTKRRASTELQAFHWLEAAGQTGEDEAFIPSRAQGRGYSARWREWSEQADPAEIQEVMDLIRAMELEAEAVGGVDDLGEAAAETLGAAAEEVVAELRAAARERSGSPTDQIRRALAAALDDGLSRADLESRVQELAATHEQPATNIRALLRALESEASAAARVAAEREQLAIAADRAEIGSALVAIDRLLPASIASAISRCIEFLPIDGTTAAMVFLTTTAAVQKLGSEVIASRRLRFRAPLNLYCAIVGRSGIKKDPAMGFLVDRPLAPLAADLAKSHNRAMEDWKAANHGKKPAERTDPPTPTYIYCSDSTGEALTKQLQRQEVSGLGLLIKRPEIGGFFQSMNAYRRGAGGDEQQLLEAYDGGGFSSLRVNTDGGGRFYERCHLSVFGGIQPSVLRDLVSNGDATGLWARFTFAPIPDRVVPLPDDDSDEEAEETAAAEALLAQVIGQVYRLPTQSLILDAEARQQFMAYETRCQQDAQRASLDAMCAAWSKAPGKALRVAGLLHLLHWVSPDGEHSERVSAAMVQRACNLVDHLTGWALGLHERATGGEASDLMRRVHAQSVAAGGPIGWRDLAPRLSKRQREEVDSAAARAAAESLAEIGAGRLSATGARQTWAYEALGSLPG